MPEQDTATETVTRTPTPLPPEKCWSCRYRGEVPGSAHSRCEHPATAEEFHDNNAMQAIGILGRHSGITTVPSRAAVTLRISGAIQGIAHGWFIWPLNFDPTWLDHCDGFTPKEGA